jgi:hypothetical protein
MLELWMLPQQNTEDITQYASEVLSFIISCHQKQRIILCIGKCRRRKSHRYVFLFLCAFELCV